MVPAKCRPRTPIRGRNPGPAASTDSSSAKALIRRWICYPPADSGNFGNTLCQNDRVVTPQISPFDTFTHFLHDFFIRSNYDQDYEK